MRKISQQAADAFKSGLRFSSGNTQVCFHEGTKTVGLFLHGNLIANKTIPSGRLYISLAGWPTATTRERLNALPGVFITQKKGEQYLNGKEISPTCWYAV